MILIVEDEYLVAASVEAAFEDRGFKVVTAADGEAAFRELSSEPKIEALVTDIRLPGRWTGWDVAVLARGLFPGLPVVYVSGDSSGDWAARGVPGSKMFGKPFSLDGLVIAVAALLPRR